MMKIAIGHKLRKGPWGGGNSFVKNLTGALKAEGFSVYYDLLEPDLDFIVLTDPRSSSPNVSFSGRQILSYLAQHPNTIVVHRINECDERKKTHFMNLRLRVANYCADHTVYVGSWLRALNLTYQHKRFSDSVILNGADETIYNSSDFVPWDGSAPIRLVTHHWGGNWMKGFDIYKKLDEMLATPQWAGKVNFTYIGNLPKNFFFKNSNYIKPLAGLALADELKKHHVYLTASVNEPGGNHQIEGGCCGLPLLYLNSGCMPEYCDGYGVRFDAIDFEASLKRIMEKYFQYLKKMRNFPHKASITSSKWVNLFYILDAKRNNLINARENKKSYVFHMLNYLIN